MSGERLDLTSAPAAASREATAERSMRFLGVHFACCDVYVRVYLNRDQTAYVGHCPRCAGRVRFAVGAGGTSERFFTAR